MSKYTLIAFTMMIAVSSCGPHHSNEGVKAEIDTQTLDRHLSVLASDDFLGRKPFTEGEEKTVHYLMSEFKSLGLKPGNGDSYFQEVPMVEITGYPDDKMSVVGKGKQFQFKVAEDFVAYTEQVEEMVSLENSELVFAGYGVVAPEYGWNDYEGLDVKGKTVIVLANDPGFGSGDSILFKGDQMTYYGRWTYKYEEAARQGAAGVLIVHETVPAGYPWLVVRNSWAGAKLNIDSGQASYKCAIQGWITRETATQIFREAGISDYSGMARNKNFKPVPLEMKVSLKVRNGIKKDKSRNVIALLEGKSRKDEYIIYSAHWDHLGVGIPADGDSIYNGAEDNATGTSALMAIAEAYSKLENKPDRSVIFIAVTAEEQGLLGSAYYAQNPIYPVEKTVANINMDGLPTFGTMKDLTITGYGHSEMDRYAKAAAAKQGRYIIPDPDPGKGYFYRSDHFNFAKVGIPALYASGSYESMEHGVDYIQEKTAEWLANRYHRPADEYNPETWDLRGIALDAQLLFNVGYTLANNTDFPKWSESSEFRNARKKE